MAASSKEVPVKAVSGPLALFNSKFATEQVLQK
jgi:hypothetical protein